MRNHIRKPVTLTPKQAETIYHASMAVLDISAFADQTDSTKPIPANLLYLLGKMLADVIEQNDGFNFE